MEENNFTKKSRSFELIIGQVTFFLISALSFFAGLMASETIPLLRIVAYILVVGFLGYSVYSLFVAIKTLVKQGKAASIGYILLIVTSIIALFVGSMFLEGLISTTL
jgi:hypothetical protein